MIEIYNDETKKIIKNWFLRWQEPQDCFDKFICLWISFNAFYCWISLEETWKRSIYVDFLKENEKEDWDISRILFFVKKNEEFFNSLKDDPNLKKFHKYINIRTRENSKKIWWIIDLFKDEKVTYIDISDFKKYILVIYQVRNNLFHWWKNLDNYNESLIKETNLIFSYFLEKLYKKYCITE